MDIAAKHSPRYLGSADEELPQKQATRQKVPRLGPAALSSSSGVTPNHSW